MNETFSFSRFARLFVKHTAEHYRTYLMATGILFGFLLLSGAFLSLVVGDAADPAFQIASYVIMLFISGGLFTSSIFSDYGDTNSAVAALTLPATSFEKFLVGWLWSLPVFLVIYTAVFYLAVWGLSGLEFSAHGHSLQFFTLWQPQMVVPLVFFIEVHALSLFGAIFFRKLQFIRTGFSFFLALALTFVLNTVFLKILTGVQVIKLAIPFGYLNFATGGRAYSVAVTQRTSLLILALMLVVAVGIWLAAYHRLKEKRI
ncbi:MAG TPA: hypothetical protein VGR89_13580 [Puia sp.]|nr:hypothetical protein [Puia sp.]